MQVGDKVIISYVSKCDQALRVEKVREAFVVDQVEAELWKLKGFKTSGYVLTDGKSLFVGNTKLDAVCIAEKQAGRCCNVHKRFLQRLSGTSSSLTVISTCPVNGCTVGLWNAESNKSLPADQETRQARRDIFELLKQNAHNKISVQTILDSVPFLNGDIANMKIGSFNIYECQLVADALSPKPVASTLPKGLWKPTVTAIAQSFGLPAAYMSLPQQLKRKDPEPKKVIADDRSFPPVREDAIREIDLD